MFQVTQNSTLNNHSPRLRSKLDHWNVGQLKDAFPQMCWTCLFMIVFRRQPHTSSWNNNTKHKFDFHMKQNVLGHTELFFLVLSRQKLSSLWSAHLWPRFLWSAPRHVFVKFCMILQIVINCAQTKVPLFQRGKPWIIISGNM